ncbi:MAG: chorismate lyase [Ghiorsea sp.]
MIQDLLENQAWLDSKTWRAEHAGQIDALHQSVLLVTSSLTRFLERKYGLKLDVHLHDQCMAFANEAEAKLLGINGQDRCLRRKVSLMSRNEVMFDAESVLPLDVLPVELMQELEAGKRPLANLLSDRGLSLSRSGLSIAKVEVPGFYHQCWARRSVLSSESGARALVTEVFHDAIWRKLNYKLG